MTEYCPLNDAHAAGQPSLTGRASMSPILKCLSDGYVATPLILAARNRGLFEVLRRSGPVRLTDLAAAQGAAPGYLRIILRALVALGWAAECQRDRFTVESSPRRGGWLARS